MNFENIQEPVADPTVPPTKAAVDEPRAQQEYGSRGPLMPPPTRVPSAFGPKISPRFPHQVDVVIAPHVFGPFRVEAVDESEAVTRVLDAHPELKNFVVKAKFNVARIEPAA